MSLPDPDRARCARCETALEAGDLRCSVCALPVPVAPDARAEAPRAKVLRCTWCGAVVAFSPAMQAPHCGFCNAVMALEQPHDPIEVARVRLPFTVGRAAAAQALHGWLGARGWFAPATLRDEATLESFVPLCWAAWLVSADARVAWTADSDAGAMRSDWAPHSGEVEMAFDNLVIPASRGLSVAECRALVPHYDLATAVVVAPDIGPSSPPDMHEIMPERMRELMPELMPELMIESFDVQRSAARAEVHAAIEQVARVRVERYVPGKRKRNVDVACMLEDQRTDRIALPAWVLAYRYRGQVFRAVVHGQRPEIVLGKSPIDWNKVARLVGSVVAGVALIVLAAILLSGCKGDPPARPDARDYTEHCIPDGTTFGSLSGRDAVQGILNVHVDAGGLIEADTTASILIVLDIDQLGTQLNISATVCAIGIPDIPVPGQDKPIQFRIPDTTVASVGVVTGTGTLASSDQTCAELTTSQLTVVLGARLDPPATAPMPMSDPTGAFPACLPDATATCALATGTNCACDQEGDGNPGSTVVAHNVPAVDLDQVYTSVRTNFQLTGHVFSTDSIEGEVTASLEQGILACRLRDGRACVTGDVNSVRNLNPQITQQPDNPSTFRAVRIPSGTTCADVVAGESIYFPR